MKETIKILSATIAIGLCTLAACKKETAQTPDYTTGFVGTYTGSVIDSGYTSNNVRYTSSVGNCQLKVIKDATTDNQLNLEAYVAGIKSYTAIAQATSLTALNIDQQSINAAFKAAGTGQLNSSNIKVELKVSDIKFIKFVGKK